MKLGVIMDPIEGINIKKDSTFAILLAAMKRGCSLFYMQLTDLYLQQQAMATMYSLKVYDDKQHWYELVEPITQPLAELDIVFVRKDPPVDSNYIHALQILQHAKDCQVVNNPSSLLTANEKLLIMRFPNCINPTIVSAQLAILTTFIQTHKTVILKPLNGMGGAGIFKVQKNDPNQCAILETMTNNGQHPIMAQAYIPEISKGDKRILLIDGEAVPYALARLPKKNEVRANLARGGQGQGQPLSERDQWLCQQVGDTLLSMGLRFVGMDVIGDYITEINITSPTCIRELDHLYQLDIGGMIIDKLMSS